MDKRTYVRTYEEERAIALSALDCILNRRKAVYASSDLTTGQRLYRVLREQGLRNVASLRKLLGDEGYRARVTDENVAAANAFARRVSEQLGDSLVIAPGPFEAPGWGQFEYLEFWATVLRTRVRAVFFNDGWQYSNGCSYEFVVAHETDLAMCDARGEPLDVAKGVELLTAAIRTLEAESFDVTVLKKNLKRLSPQTLENQ